MQTVRASFGADSTTEVVPFRALLATAQGASAQAARLLERLGAELEVADQLYDLLAMVFDDPRVAQIIVIECDAFGGLAAAKRAAGFLAYSEIYIPILLITSEPDASFGAQDRKAPFVLRGPLSQRALGLACDRLLNGALGETPVDLVADLVDLSGAEV